MTVNIKITGYQDSLRALRRELESYSKGKMYCTVGVHAQAGSYKKGITVAEVAAANNFGTDKIPARPFLKEGVERAKTNMIKTAEESMKKGRTPRQIIDQLGALAVRGVQEQIDATTTPPNAPYTVKKKGSSHPLIDTGLLKKSITYQLRNSKKEEK